ncbi:MAG: hypothetical protein LC118_08275 [Dehalococcoidia bacterium]|nr:hypothetical protein [Dehalococcoidia bacterium]
MAFGATHRFAHAGRRRSFAFNLFNRCTHRWSELALVRAGSATEPAIMGWFCLDCGRRQPMHRM